MARICVVCANQPISGSVSGTRRVRVGSRTVWRSVPNYVTKRVFDGYRTVTRELPVYKTKQVVTGYKTVEKQVPRYVNQRVKMGERVEWKLVDKPRRTSSSSGQGGLASIAPQGSGPAVPGEGGSSGSSQSGGFDWGVWKRADMAEVQRALSNGVDDPADRKFVVDRSSAEGEGFDLGAWKREDMAEVRREMIKRLHAADRKFMALQNSNQSSSQEDDQTATSDPLGEHDGSQGAGDTSISLEELRQLLGLGDDVYDLAEVLLALRQTRIKEVDGTLRIFGPQSARSTLGWKKMTNWLRPNNIRNLWRTSPIRKISRGNAITIGLVMLADVFFNYTDYKRGELDKYEFYAAVTVDVGVTSGAVLLAGAIIGALSGSIAGAAGGFGFGSGIAAGIGAVGGAIVGVLAAAALVSLFDASGAREYTIEQVADLYESWGDNE